MNGYIVCGGAPAHGPVLGDGDLDPDLAICCAGAAMTSDPLRCTCWEPTYDLEQLPPRTELAQETRPTMCGDCAYQPDSRERLRGDELEDLPNFTCHRGMRRPATWRHPDGRVRPGSLADYDPPIINGIAYRADGRPASLCGGWALAQEEKHNG